MGSLLLVAILAVRFYVADSADNKLTVIDDGKPSATIAVSANPQAIAVSPDGRRLYVTSGANVLDVIDRATSRLTRTVPVGPKPGCLAVSPDGRDVFVCIGGRPEIDVIDTASLMKVGAIEMPGPPRSIAVTPDETRMLVGAASGVTVINIRTEETEFTIPLNGAPASIAIDFDRHLVIHRLFLRMTAAPGTPGFDVVDYPSRKVTAKIALPSADVLAVAPSHQTLWATAGDSVVVFSLPDLKRVASIPVGPGAGGIAFEPNGKHAFVVDTGANAVTEIDAATYKEVARIPVGKGPAFLLGIE